MSPPTSKDSAWSRAKDGKRLEWLPRAASRVGSKTGRIGTEQHFRWLEGVVASILVLNGLDALFTVFWVYTGRADEGNPLMEELVHRYPLLFIATKLALVTGGSFILWIRRKRPLAVVGIFALFVVYYLVLLVHLDAFRGLFR